MQPSGGNGGNAMTGQQQQQHQTEAEQEDEIVQVVYQSNQSGSLIGVESSLIPGAYESGQYGSNIAYNNNDLSFQDGNQVDAANDPSQQQQEQAALHQPLARAASTLPSVAEESSSGAGPNQTHEDPLGGADTQALEERTSRSISQANEEFVCDERNHQQREPVADLIGDPYCVPHGCTDLLGLGEMSTDFCMNPDAIYSTINKQQQPRTGDSSAILGQNYSENYQSTDSAAYGDGGGGGGNSNTYDQRQQGNTYANDEENRHPSYQPTEATSTGGNFRDGAQDEERKDIEQINAEICQIISRQKQGAAESGSLRNNFKKKLVISASTNENDLIAHRQKLLDSQDANNIEVCEGGGGGEPQGIGSLPSKFKRTHSVSFNVNSSRNSRHSVDIRNLPSYLTVKRASIVDVAKGAMSSLIHSFGSGTATASSISKDSRRDSSAIDEEPIFEEPIAPTLSLGQRVALVKNDGAEFGTVGWIGQLADVDDDWVVGVIFDNMIGNCDGAYNGIRYFYSRENFAMFVPLSTLTKTDNYIGRPETGTMLSRMSVSLKPGQLISIQRSSIRLQHCFLNAPHQRVGHDVRAVSNRLHCQCHNCGPCAHLTKQHSRVNALPAFGAHHAVNKKNSLAHAAVEILAHHHHHYHEEEHHEEEDYQFGDNAAHACNFVRYSCCQQNGGTGHEFSSDCGLVRPELLDNLIHAPRAPHRRSARPRRMRRAPANQPVCGAPPNNLVEQAAVSTLDSTSKLQLEHQIEGASDGEENSRSRGSPSCSSCSSRSSSRGPEDGGAQYSQTTNSYQMESMNYFQGGSGIYNTLDSRMSLHDQQRFIYQRESNTSTRSRRRDQEVDEYGDEELSEGIITRVRRCLGCLKKRSGSGRKRPKKRKLSARNRLIEYRRKQSTFVPSTLAKPQEDFASHGIVLPGWGPSPSGQEGYNSDYSSYSKSSGSNSPHNSPGRTRINQSNPEQFISMDHNVQMSGDQLKSSNTIDRQLNYNDYTFDNDGYRSYEKFAQSQDSDLGYFDVMTNSSGGTLKNIVDNAIEREESLQQLPPIDPISPIQSDSVSQSCCDHIEISSPTVSMADQADANQLSERLESLDIDKDDTTNNSQ